MSNAPLVDPGNGTRARSGDRLGLIAFLVATFALPWGVWLSAVAHDAGRLGFHVPTGIALWTLVLPTVGYLLLAKGAGGIRAFAAGLVRWRVNAGWYAVALAGPVALTAAAVAVASMVGDVPVGASLALPEAVGYLVFGVLLFGVTEEPVWRGITLSALQDRMTPLAACVVVGLVWGVWHTPLWFTDGASQQQWPYAGFIVFAVAESVLIGWVYTNTGRSILLAAVLHASTDASLAYSGVLDAGDGSFWLACAVFVAAAALVSARYGPRLTGIRDGGAADVAARTAAAR
jgi:membrane protease YdiL (CAAX protease family)